MNVDDITDSVVSLYDRDTSRLSPRMWTDFQAVLLDTLTCSLVSAQQEDVIKLKHHVGQQNELAYLWWSQYTAKRPEAAYVNSYMSHRLDFDSTHYATYGHPGSIVLPSLFAFFDGSSLKGRDVFEAYTIGLELMSFLGQIFGAGLRENRIHPTSVLGQISAIAAISKLHNADAKTFIKALNLGATTLTGFQGSFGSIGKVHQVANACRNSVVTWDYMNLLDVSIAKRNTWVDNVLLLSRSRLEDIGVDNYDSLSFMSEEVSTSFKPYPSCAYFHQAVEWLLDKGCFGVDVKKVSRVTIAMPTVVVNASLYNVPDDPDQAKFSLPFHVAAVLYFRTIGPSTFTNETITNSEFRDFLGRIRANMLDDTMHLHEGGRVSGYITIHYKNGSIDRFDMDPVYGPDDKDGMTLVTNKLRTYAAEGNINHSVEGLIYCVNHFEDVTSEDWTKHVIKA